jgi:hypothetical protein
LEGLEETLGPAHPHVADVQFDTGELCAAQGRHEDAQPHYWWALLVRETKLGEEHPDTIRTALQYAKTLEALGRAEDAAKLRTEYEPRQKEWEKRKAAMRKKMEKLLGTEAGLLEEPTVQGQP